MVRIAFSAKLQSGKDVAVNYLISKYGGTQTRFANRLYKIHDETMKILELENYKDRRFLQIVATEWARNRDPWVFARAFKKDYQDIQGNLFCVDARFPETEFTTLKDMGFFIVKIERSWLNRLDSEFNRQIQANQKAIEQNFILGYVKILWNMFKQAWHKSERGLNTYKNYDFTIKNNGSLIDFYIKIEKVYNQCAKQSNGKV